MTSPDSQATDSDPIPDLLLRAQGGDRAALEQLFALLRPMLLRRAQRTLGARNAIGARPSDLVQETCVLALRGLAGFRGQTAAELRMWMLQILHNSTRQAVRHGRAGKRNEQLDSQLPADLCSPAASPSAVVAGRQGYRRIVAAVSRLPARQRQAIYLRLLQERTLAEISLESGAPESAVASLIKRGLDRLRRELLPAATKQRAASAAQVDAGLLEYLRLCDLGSRPARAPFLQQHAPAAAALAPLLDWMDAVCAQLADS
jgi:RNA polymerase sigma-70 factor (ECF subfamily)